MKLILSLFIVFGSLSALAKVCQCYSYEGQGDTCAAVENMTMEIPWYRGCSFACGTAELAPSESEAIRWCIEESSEVDAYRDTEEPAVR